MSLTSGLFKPYKGSQSQYKYLTTSSSSRPWSFANSALLFPAGSKRMVSSKGSAPNGSASNGLASNGSAVKSKIRPSQKVASSKLDIWTIFNEAADSCEKPPVNLGQGFMNFKPPEYVLTAAKSALDVALNNQYSPSKGRPKLRKALSDAYSPLYGRKLNPDTEIVVTAGANEGMFSAFAAFLDPGDEVIVMEPFFDQYISNITMNGGKVVYVPLHPPEKGDTDTVSASEWTLDLSELEAAITPRTKMVVLNTPHNPIGKMFTLDELRGLADLIVRHDIILLSDEVYDRLDFEPHYRIGTLNPEIAARTMTVGSAGKTFGCTGWRVGWLIGPEELIKYVLSAHTRVVFTVNSPLQEATAVAFEKAEEEQYYSKTVEAYKERMKVLCEVFDELGLPYTIPQGGYFVLVNFSKIQIPSDFPLPDTVTKGRARDFALAYWLTKAIGVVAIPPTEFYHPDHASMAENYLRFATCKDLDTLREGGRRLRKLRDYM